ncbi:MAG TPA: glycosyltransferase [Solirubrobacterales bacterium]|nr:glycosyltransferase [Solirubrobacterales bacterium]
MRLAAIVPASDDPPSLPLCTAALRAGERAPDELIVQREPAGGGPAAARNAAATGSGADVLVFVDSDVEVHPDALARIERRLLEDPGLSGVFGAYDDEPAAPGLASRFRNLLHHHVHVSSPGEAETFWAGLGAVRRDAFEAVGGFDAARFREPSVEDIELGMRLREGGARLLLDPAIRGRHLKAWTPLSMVRTDFSRRGVPWARLLLAGNRRSGALNLGARHRASAVAAVALAFGLIARRPRIALAALLAMASLNRDFYSLLARRGGPRLLVGGVALHALHLLTAVASVPVAVVLHLRERGPDERS